jgi:hypothetical protein
VRVELSDSTEAELSPAAAGLSLRTAIIMVVLTVLALGAVVFLLK